MKSPALLIGALVLLGSGCGQRLHGGVILEITSRVRDTAGRPIAGATVYLVDKSVSERGVRAQEREIVCSTDNTGHCEARVVHTFSYDRHPWDKRGHNPVLNSLIVVAEKHAYQTGSFRIRDLTREQIAGRSEVACEVVLEADDK